MVKNTYSHPVLAGYKMDKIKAAISKHVFTEGMHTDKESPVELIVSKDDELKSFYHPLLVDNSVFVDARTFARRDKENDDFKISNETEYNFTVYRAQLELAWVSEHGRFALSNVSSIPANFYSKWVSEGITRVYNLDPENQMILAVVSAWYFFCQFHMVEEWDVDEMMPKVVSYVSRATNVPTDRVLPIVESCKGTHINNTHEFAAIIKHCSKGDVLGDLTSRGIYNMLTNNWRGAHGSEVAMLAIDYPPALYAMIRGAYNDRTYRKTAIQLILDRTKKTVDTKSWIMSCKVALVSQNILRK